MTTKDLKAEAREKLALNMHQAIAVYAIEFLLFVTLIALVAVACVCLGTSMMIAAIVVICYGVVLLLAMVVISGIFGFAMADFYIACYRCAPYNIRRLGDTVARNGVHKIFVMNMIRTLLGFLLLLALIVPGVIYLCRTSMASYLLIANPRMKAKEALKASSKVMSGKTGGYFGLMMSMLGWFLIGVLSLGLGFVFVLPYIQLAKTEYYKRNLQGDRNVYRVQPQPVSPMPVQGAVGMAAQQYVEQPVAQGGQAQNGAQYQQSAPVRPIYIDEEMMQPISAVNDDVIKEMNETMRDFGGDAVIDVPEVPLKPITVAKKETSSQSFEHTVSNPVDGSDFVEIVKPLTTVEANEDDPYAQKIDEMLSGNVKQATAVKHDYFGGPKSQNPNDFVTTDVSTKIDSMSDDDLDTPVMSDEAFAEFMRNFDEETTQFAAAQANGRTPNGQSASNVSSNADSFGSSRNSQNAGSARPSAFGASANAGSSARQSAFGAQRQTPNAASKAPESPARPNRVSPAGSPPPEDRAERMRREREARLNSLKNNGK